MEFDPIRELTEAGIDLSPGGEEQLEVLAGLSEEETALLISIQLQMMDAAPEVEAHTIGGLLF
ncbi:aroma-sacti cluster domain-containing protein [Planobispora takensis]|uniref:Uncharacterized protein n=1 Tax=Planobispora takensis TaxID=1367882 RepID=A0A8J3WTM5_9ACTN|nr:aroma-sacti cluster domain-containing protein [Planobispora takensis]GII01390.1 hypothetical protein Pta02_33980 [Planobispora takensis]